MHVGWLRVLLCRKTMCYYHSGIRIRKRKSENFTMSRNRALQVVMSTKDKAEVGMIDSEAECILRPLTPN